ncbi:MAG: His-Xaa-Ser system radical SAM maturase HxsB [Acidobacteriota bacterium]
MVGKGFHGREHYRPSGTYRFFPFRFTRFEHRILAVNEVGEHLFLSQEDFDDFVGKRLPTSSAVYADLKGKHFLFDSDALAPFGLLATKYRTKKSSLADFTALHIFVVTLRCEHSCGYCQVSRVSADRERFDMSRETADRALDLVFRSPSPRVKIEFQGGEPLLNFERIREIVETAEARIRSVEKEVDFVVTTNLAMVTDEMLHFFRDYRVCVSTSLDGPEAIHNANRPRPGSDSYARTIEGLSHAREVLGHDSVAALMTATRRSLEEPEAIVDEYVRQGFSSIFLRPLSPYGFAKKAANRIGYSVDEYLMFYVRALHRILEINRAGRSLVETYAQILLTRMLTPFGTGYVDLQSPAGAGIAVAVYNYDGDVYASDESRMLAEMGDRRFRLGNVLEDRYEDIFGGRALREIVAESVIESWPGCADCAFLPWCGADPVLNYATGGDLVGHRPTSDFHRKHDFLFRHLLNLYESDADVRKIFSAWVMNVPMTELEASA